jgi:hypothetical protein
LQLQKGEGEAPDRTLEKTTITPAFFCRKKSRAISLAGGARLFNFAAASDGIRHRRMSMASHRKVRRMAGLIAKYFSNELLRRVVDPRSERGRSWKSHLPLLKAVLLGLACGCKGLGEVEELTGEMHKSVRKLIGIPRRTPDTTLRDLLVHLKAEQLSELLYVVGYDAWRRKALVNDTDFPWGILSQDGKYPVIRDTEGSDFLQVHHDENGEVAYGMLRTITATLVSAAGRPILGAVPVPAETNEKGAFKKAFGDMVRIYGRLFRVVMYDAGAASKDNADAVLKAGKHYFFQIADPRWVMHQTIELLMSDKAKTYSAEEVVSQRERLVRHLTVLEVSPMGENRTMWGHTRTVLKVLSETVVDGVVVGTKTRYFVTSLESSELSAAMWLKLIVLRWGVETSHQILDVAFEEDARPWITKDAQGALAVMLLRRVVYTVLTLFRSVTQRSDDNRVTPFRKLMEWLKDTLKWPNAEEFEDLRPRRFAVPKALA